MLTFSILDFPNKVSLKVLCLTQFKCQGIYSLVSVMMRQSFYVQTEDNVSLSVGDVMVLLTVVMAVMSVPALIMSWSTSILIMISSLILN